MNETANSFPILAWLRLARISALPSAVSNILLGFLLANGNWQPIPELVMLIISSSCLYVAGMILNDAFDLEKDLIERPRRPLPSGQISRRSATTAGVIFLCGGIGCAAVAGWLSSQHQGQLWKPVAIAALLSVSIVLYDGWLKQSIVAPLLMGGCRSLNLLLGASTIAASPQNGELIFGYPALIWWIAFSIGIYITGVTLLARKEATIHQSSRPLVVAAIVIGLGLMGLALINVLFPDFVAAKDRRVERFPWLIALIAFPIARRVVFAIINLKPTKIQAAVITCLRSIIILDAAMCFLVVPEQPTYALLVVGLLLPALVLSRFVPPT